MSENVTVYGCASRPLPPARYFLSEELCWRIICGIVREVGRGASRITRKDVLRFINSHTCNICGRVYLSSLELATHHALREFAGVLVIDEPNEVFNLDKIFHGFGRIGQK